MFSVPFGLWVRIPNVVAQVTLSYLVVARLGARGYGERTRLAAAALIAVGPLFVIDSFYAQIDSLAIYPAVLAVAYWSEGKRRRSVVSGILIGIGTALKTVPILALLALLPTARSNRERAELVGTAVAVPLVTILPFLARDPSGVLSIRRYTGIPGVGGLTMLVQPRLLRFWLYGDLVFPSAVVYRLMTYGSTLLAAVLLVLLIALCWRRVDALTAATMTWLVVYVLGPSPTPLYLCLGVPFFLLAGRIRLAAVLQALAVGPAVLLYLHLPVPHRIVIYASLMGLVWVACLAALLTVGAAAWRGPARLTLGPDAP
jgi:4-amino-4-deoxy-L-arabinose transferase-like glycosyltransferase